MSAVYKDAVYYNQYLARSGTDFSDKYFSIFSIFYKRKDLLPLLQMLNLTYTSMETKEKSHRKFDKIDYYRLAIFLFERYIKEGELSQKRLNLIFEIVRSEAENKTAFLVKNFDEGVVGGVIKDDADYSKNDLILLVHFSILARKFDFYSIFRKALHSTYGEFNLKNMVIDNENSLISVSNDLMNSSIAIVGPCKETLSGEEIDGYDFVFKPNFTPEKNADMGAEYFGHRCDYNYLASTVARNYFKESIKTNGCKFVFDSKRSYKIWEEIESIDERIFFVPACNYKSLTTLGELNAIPRIVYDLYVMSKYRDVEFSKIKVFNVNLWLSQSPYNKNYTPNKFKADFLHMKHDVLTNFNFMRDMYEQGFIEVDSSLEKILKMDPYDYVQQVFSLHYS